MSDTHMSWKETARLKREQAAWEKSDKWCEWYSVRCTDEQWEDLMENPPDHLRGKTIIREHGRPFARMELKEG